MFGTLWVMALMFLLFFWGLSFCFGGARRFFFRTKKLVIFAIIIIGIYMLFIK